MRLLRYVLSVAIALSLTLAAQAGEAQKAKNKAKGKKGTTVAGTVVEVKKEKDKDEGTITVKIQAKKKKDATAPAKPAEEKTFKVTTATKFATVSGKKGEQQVTATNFSAVQKGERVRMTVKDDTAEVVKILGKGKKKKAAD
ncbi:MAG TPA: hypothetical protein VKD72_39965 [Gemmataceae bacterium]|nr:hypothetical protein [Gemmataceae bacterium]